jgi:maleamate amidohydrolase
MSAIHEGYQGVFDSRLRFGRKAALVVVDFMEVYADPQSPFYAPAVVEASLALSPLLEAVRERGWPVIWTSVEYAHPEALDGGLFVEKVPALKLLRPAGFYSQTMRHLTALEDPATDSRIVKQYPSAFFATSLATRLNTLGCDTVLVAGCTTSGCVRATVVDALQHGFRPFVVENCVGDRSAEAHRINLLDMQSKYAEVVFSDAAIELVMNSPAKESL